MRRALYDHGCYVQREQVQVEHRRSGRGIAGNRSERLVKVGSADAQCATGACLLGLVNLFQQPLATGSGGTRPQNARASCVRAEGLEISSHEPDGRMRNTMQVALIF